LHGLADAVLGPATAQVATQGVVDVLFGGRGFCRSKATVPMIWPAWQ